MEFGAIQNKGMDTYKSTADKTNTVEQKDKSKNNNKNNPETKKTIKAGELKLPGEKDSTIKELLGKKAALKIQMEQFEKDSAKDDLTQEHIDKKEALLEEGNYNQSKINSLENLKEELKETYAVEDGSTEQRDLLILEKQAKKENLTDDEKNILANMGPMTDYQKMAMDYTNMEIEFQKRADAATKDYFNEIRTINAIKLERLKDDPMVDAKKAAEGLLEKVDSEIQQSLIEEIKNRVNENLDIDPNSSILDNPQALIDQKKVTEEDLKGLAVDEKV